MRKYFVFSPSTLFTRAFVKPALDGTLRDDVQTELFIELGDEDLLEDDPRIPVHRAAFIVGKNLPRAIAGAGRLFGLFRDEDCVVHVHCSTSAPLILALAAAAGVEKRIYHNHGSVVLGYEPPERWAFELLEWLNCTLATDVFFVNEDIRDEFARDGIVDRDKTHFVGPGSAIGIDLEYFDPAKMPSREEAREQLGLQQDEFITLYVGRPKARKGLHFLLDLWANDPRIGPSDRLLCVGSSEDDVRRVLGYVPENVTAYGVKTELRPYNRAADVVCLPSEFEGLGYALLEGAACERPLLGTNIDGTNAILRHGVQGLKFEVNDADSFFDQYDRLKSDPSLRAELGRRARERAVEFGRERFMVTYRAIIDRIFARNEGRRLSD